MILEKIKNDLNQALKAKEKTKVSVLRFLLSAIHDKEIRERKKLTDEEVISVVQKQIKERRDSIEAFKIGGRDDLVKKEQEEMDILSTYLPQQISQDDLVKIIEKVISETEARGLEDFGRVMKEVMAKVRGQADGSVVAELVRKVLNRV